MALPVDIDTTYSDTGPASRSLHQQHHDELHRITNGLPLQVRGPSMTTKYAHIQAQHGQVQAAIADLGTSGTSTVAQIEAKINAILLALRAQGAILP